MFDETRFPHCAAAYRLVPWLSRHVQDMANVKAEPVDKSESAAKRKRSENWSAVEELNLVEEYDLRVVEDAAYAEQEQANTIFDTHEATAYDGAPNEMQDTIPEHAQHSTSKARRHGVDTSAVLQLHYDVLMLQKENLILEKKKLLLEIFALEKSASLAEQQSK